MKQSNVKKYTPLVQNPLTALLYEYDKLGDCDLCDNDGTHIIDYLDRNGEHDRTWDYCECIQEHGTKAHFKANLCKDFDKENT